MKITTLFLIISMFYISCSHTKYELSNREKAVNNQMAISAQTLSKKYNMRPCATTVAMPEGDIQYLELKFDIIGHLSQNAIRIILINSMNDFLNNINNDAELCSYLDKGCLDISEVGIGLFFFDSQHYPIEKPEIGIASIRKGQLRYYRCDPNDISVNGMEETKESYEEALEILRSQGKCPLVH